MEIDLTKLKKKIVFRTVLFSVLFFLLVFMPAGSPAFWEAWVYFILCIGSSIFIATRLIERRPELLERRLQRREEIKEQKRIQLTNTILYFFGFVIAGLDHRYNLSVVSIGTVLVSNMMVLIGYFIIFAAMTENAYASSIVQVMNGQKVVSTGLYGVVRHPMYSGVVIMVLFTPLALGSLWAFAPFGVMPFTIVLRLLNEEKLLLKELGGYEEYCGKVRYRLIPFVW